MKTRTKILIGITALVAVFGVGMFVWVVWAHQPTQRFTIAVTGQSGLAFAGVIKADGAATSVSGVVPTNYVFTARSVGCRFEKQRVGGALRVCLRMEPSGGVCSVTASESARGVRAFLSVHNGSSSTF
jgi:hypothetical protein